jgi:flagellar FliJ protein
MSAQFSLAGLLRLRKLEEDQRAVELNSARDREAIGLARTRRIRRSLAEGHDDPTAHASLASIAATRASSATMLSELSELDGENAAQVESAVAAHAEAHRKTLGLEKLETRFEEKKLAGELRDEQLLLDDLSSRAWHLANGEGAS